MTLRFPPIPDTTRTERQRQVAADIVSGPRGEVRGPFVPLLYAPDLAGRIQALGETIRFGTSLPDELLELAVLVTARHFDCANIWESHSKLAAKAGLPASIVGDVAARRRPGEMTQAQQLVFDVSSELLGNHKVSEETFAAAVRHFGRPGVIEIGAACGYYSMLAAVLNLAEPPLDPGSVPFA